MIKKLYKRINRYVPAASIFFYILAFISVLLYIAFALNADFADFFNRYISSIFRSILSHLTGWFNFSLAEAFIIFIPVTAITVVTVLSRISDESRRMSIRCISGLLSVCAVMYSMFVFNFAAGYKGSTLDVKLNIEREDISTEELYETANIVVEKLNEASDDVTFKYGSASVMPYNTKVLSEKLDEAYAKAADKYSFIPRLSSRVKPVVLSSVMTYTHISGVYSFFSGEANINMNYPDFVIAYSAAHEMAHQRGTAREDEANFVAYLVCIESDDSYLRYSAYLNMYQYLTDALYDASQEYYNEVTSNLDTRVMYEMISYSDFFDTYRDSTVSKVSETINNTYLTVQGTAGTKSYGMVVDLAAAYYLDTDASN